MPIPYTEDDEPQIFEGELNMDDLKTFHTLAELFTSVTFPNLLQFILCRFTANGAPARRTKKPLQISTKVDGNAVNMAVSLLGQGRTKDYPVIIVCKEMDKGEGFRNFSHSITGH